MSINQSLYNMATILVAVFIASATAQLTGNFLEPGFIQSLATRYAPISLNETEFILFTKQNLEGMRVTPGDSNSLVSAGFDPLKKVVIATHGFQASRYNPGQIELREAHMRTLDVNYFVVDWSKCANSSFILYPVSLNCALKVGGFIAEFVRFLENNGADTGAMQLIGHSLGSHAVSQVSNAGIRVGRITGFDPTQVLFWNRPESERLDAGDADFVDVIHTNINLQGWNKILGDVDFFPSGGDDQPSCGFLDYYCNHEMPYHYYSESLYDNKKYPATKCNSKRDANRGSCKGPLTYMGVSSIDGPHGIFYVDVTGK